MKTIFTLIILAFSVCSFGQTKSTYGKDESDTIGTARVGFSEISQKMFSDSQTEILELQKQLQEKVKRQDDMFMLLCGAAVPPVDPKRVIKDGIQIRPGELILKYRK